MSDLTPQERMRWFVANYYLGLAPKLSDGKRDLAVELVDGVLGWWSEAQVQRAYSALLHEMAAEIVGPF